MSTFDDTDAIADILALPCFFLIGAQEEGRSCADCGQEGVHLFDWCLFTQQLFRFMP